jgi:hypothetical protein
MQFSWNRLCATSEAGDKDDKFRLQAIGQRSQNCGQFFGDEPAAGGLRHVDERCENAIDAWHWFVLGANFYAIAQQEAKQAGSAAPGVTQKIRRFDLSLAPTSNVFICWSISSEPSPGGAPEKCFAVASGPEPPLSIELIFNAFSRSWDRRPHRVSSRAWAISYRGAVTSACRA